MTHSVATGDSEGRAYHWWAKFLAYSTWLDGEEDLQTVLDRHGANARCDRLICVGDPIDFDTEQAFTMFVLRWS